MKAKIGILTEELVRKRMIRIAEGSKEPSPPFLFESLAVLSQLLSNENVELLNLIDREKPNNLAEKVGAVSRMLLILSKLFHLKALLT